MRLAFVNQFYRPDIAPTGQLMASVAEHRAALGDEVTVITSRSEYVRPPNAPRDSVVADPSAVLAGPRVIRVRTPGFSKKWLVSRLLDYLAFYIGATWRLATLPRQDVIVSLTTPPYIAFAAVLHKLLHRQTKVVLWSMDCYPDVAERSGVIRAGGVLSRLLRVANRILFRRIDHLVCLDGAMADLLVSQYAPVAHDGRLSLPVTIIPNWEDRAIFPATSTPAVWADRTSLGLDGRFVVLYLGNTGVGHSFDTVLDAAEKMRDAGDAVRFLFVGGGSRWQEIQSHKTRRQLDNVILHGYVPKEQTPAVMASAGAALITLRDEALGVMSPSKLHSNLAMSLPVVYVGPGKSNVDEALARFGCGVSLRNGDADGLVHYLRRLAADPQMCADLRARARRAFDEAYCDAQTLPQFDRVFAQVAATSPASPAACRCSNR
jgi:glycosyltransferase involved in cell wall biosynthesis